MACSYFISSYVKRRYLIVKADVSKAGLFFFLRKRFYFKQKLLGSGEFIHIRGNSNSLRGIKGLSG